MVTTAFAEQPTTPAVEDWQGPNGPLYAATNIKYPWHRAYTNWRMMPESLIAEATKIVYIDIHGNRWDLAGSLKGRQGVVMTTEVQGLQQSPAEVRYTEGAYVLGAEWERVDYNKREILCGVIINPNGNADFAKTSSLNSFSFRMLEEKWWAGWSYEVEGHLGVFTRSHGWRWLKVRLGEAPDDKMSTDPTGAFGNNLNTYDMKIVATYPFYAKKALLGTWKNTEDRSVLFGRGEGTIRLANRGDVPAWPKYIVSGPGRAWIQDGTEMIELPYINSNDGFVLVDTDPSKRTLTASKDPVDNLLFKFMRNVQLLDFILDDLTSQTLPIWRRFEGKGFQHQIPGKSVASLKVMHDHPDGTITAILPQHYTRAWG